MPGGQWARLSPDFAQAMDAAMMITQTSGDAFSPALGRLVDCWDFGPPGPVAVAPRADHIIALLPTCDARRLAFEPDTRRLRQPGGVALDLSGIAKGYAVDALDAMQRAMGRWKWAAS